MQHLTDQQLTRTLEHPEFLRALDDQIAALEQFVDYFFPCTLSNPVVDNRIFAD